MKILKEDGTVVEGMAVSETLVQNIDDLEEILHRAICVKNYSSSHSVYSVKPCRDIAIKLLTRCLDPTIEPSFLGLLAELRPQPEPETAPTVNAVEEQA